MSTASRLFSGILVLLLLTVPAWAGSMPSNVKIGETAQGKVLTNAKGMTLYTFKKDVADSGVSMCKGVCAKHWPPLQAPLGFLPGGGWNEIVRANGLTQLAYHGKPLYTFIKDKKPGDITGNGFKHLWDLARP